MDTTPIYQLPYVEPADHPNVYPAADRAQAEAVEAALATYASPRMLRKKTAAQPLTAANTYYNVTFESDEGNGTGVTYSNGVFTIGRAGVYQINTMGNLTGPASSTVRWRLVVDGTIPAGEAISSGTGGLATLSVSRAYRFTAGQTFTVQAQANATGSSVNGSGIGYTMIDLTLIAP